jgi:hypothetical protein
MRYRLVALLVDQKPGLNHTAEKYRGADVGTGGLLQMLEAPRDTHEGMHTTHVTENDR